MNRIAVYTDEDVSTAVAPALVRRGLRATTWQDHGKARLSDEAQLRFARSIGAVLLTHNIHDFPRIHYEFMARAESHSGIIVARQSYSIGELVRRVLRLSVALSAEEMPDRLEYLSQW